MCLPMPSVWAPTGGLETNFRLVCKYSCSFISQVRGLFKGLASPVIGNVPIQAICFGAYGAARRAIYDLEGGAGSLTNYNQQPLHQVALAGGFAGFANCFISTPTGELFSKLWKSL